VQRFLNRTLTENDSSQVTATQSSLSVSTLAAWYPLIWFDYGQDNFAGGTPLYGGGVPMYGASSNAGQIVTSNSYTPILEAEIPYYNNQVASIVAQPLNSAVVPTYPYSAGQSSFVYQVSSTSATADAVVYTAVGDDFSFGFIKGMDRCYLVWQHTSLPPAKYRTSYNFGFGASLTTGVQNSPLIFPYHYTEYADVTNFGLIPNAW